MSKVANEVRCVVLEYFLVVALATLVVALAKSVVALNVTLLGTSDPLIQAKHLPFNYSSSDAAESLEKSHEL